MQEPDRSDGLAATIVAFLRTLSSQGRRRLLKLMAATVIGTLAELATIGAVVPFLALLADPERAAQNPGWSLFISVTGGGSNREIAATATLLLVGAAIAGAASRLLILRLTVQLVTMTAHDISCSIFARALRRPYRNHVEGNSAELLGSVEKLHLAVSSAVLPLVQVPVAAAMATAIAALLLLIEPVAAAIGIVVLGFFYVFLGKALRLRLRRSSSEFSQIATSRMKTLQETMGSIRDILLSETQPVFDEEYRRLDLRFRRAQQHGMFAAAAPRFLAEALGIVLIGFMVLFMSSGSGSFAAALPLVGALALGAQRMMPLMQQIYHGVTSINANLFLLQDIIHLLRTPIVEAAPKKSLPLRFERSIELDGVGFRFGPALDWALRDIHLHIAAGERIAITGRTGSGKSTFFDLLMGLLEPDAGEIRIDGVRLDDHTRAAWQRRVAHVPQSIYLTDRSVAANIAFGAPHAEIDMDRVRAAARRAQIDALIESLPEGYHTPVGERGIRVSGGERQRIAIARALYRGARILILDEATAALDEATETAVMDAICSADPDLTILVSTHRLSSRSRFDRIITFEGGRIVGDTLVGRTQPA